MPKKDGALQSACVSTSFLSENSHDATTTVARVKSNAAGWKAEKDREQTGRLKMFLTV